MFIAFGGCCSPGRAGQVLISLWLLQSPCQCILGLDWAPGGLWCICWSVIIRKYIGVEKKTLDERSYIETSLIFPISHLLHVEMKVKMQLLIWLNHSLSPSIQFLMCWSSSGPQSSDACLLTAGTSEDLKYVRIYYNGVRVLECAVHGFCRKCLLPTGCYESELFPFNIKIHYVTMTSLQCYKD